MSKEKNFNDFVSYKNEKIVFCQDGRIFLIDKDTELVDLRDCENCKQKDQRISELETNLRETLDLVKNSNYKEVLEENISLGNSLNTSAELNIKYKERIAELERENKTAVKEFAYYVINNILPKDLCGLHDYQAKISNGIRIYLKERGIE